MSHFLENPEFLARLARSTAGISIESDTADADETQPSPTSSPTVDSPKTEAAKTAQMVPPRPRERKSEKAANEKGDRSAADLYARQLEELSDMGFTNAEANLQVRARLLLARSRCVLDLEACVACRLLRVQEATSRPRSDF